MNIGTRLYNSYYKLFTVIFSYSIFIYIYLQDYKEGYRVV